MCSVELTKLQQNAISEITAEVAREFNVRFLYLTGSLAVGLGNELSDVDLVASVDRHSSAGVRDYNVGGLTVDVEIRSMDYIDASVHDLLSFKASGNSYAEILKRRRQLRDVGRLFQGAPVLGADAFSAYTTGMDSMRLRQLHLLYYGAEAAKFMRDAYGASKSGDFATAEDTSLYTLRITAEMLMASVGNFYLAEREKFLRRRMSQCSIHPSLVKNILDCLADGAHSNSKEEVMPRVARRLQLAEAFTGFAGLYGWGTTQMAASSYRVPLVRHESRGPTCNVLVPLDRGGLLLGRNAFELSRPALLVWHLYNTEPWRSIAARFAEVAGERGDSFVQATLGQLSEAGLLEEGL